MSVVRLRIEIERELRRILAVRGQTKPAGGISAALAELRRDGLVPANSQSIEDALDAINRAARGIDLEAEALHHAGALGSAFLADLRNMGSAEAG